jgi:hypothetical protein
VPKRPSRNGFVAETVQLASARPYPITTSTGPCSANQHEPPALYNWARKSPERSSFSRCSLEELSRAVRTARWAVYNFQGCQGFPLKGPQVHQVHPLSEIR